MVPPSKAARLFFHRLSAASLQALVVRLLSDFTEEIEYFLYSEVLCGEMDRGGSLGNGVGWIEDQGDDVRVVEVKGLLQDELEKQYKEYVAREVGKDIYFDPKEIGKSSIPKHYSACVDFGRKRCPELLKNGWKALAGY